MQCSRFGTGRAKKRRGNEKGITYPDIEPGQADEIQYAKKRGGFMEKKNCWEYKGCGREPGGKHVRDLGVCPVTVFEEYQGAHGGKNAGRACWVVAGTLCGGKIQGSYAQKLHNCWGCDFMNAVKEEEEPSPFGFSHTRLGIERVVQKIR
jgi:hypothetical protein